MATIPSLTDYRHITDAEMSEIKARVANKTATPADFNATRAWAYQNGYGDNIPKGKEAMQPEDADRPLPPLASPEPLPATVPTTGPYGALSRDAFPTPKPIMASAPPPTPMAGPMANDPPAAPPQSVASVLAPAPAPIAATSTPGPMASNAPTGSHAAFVQSIYPAAMRVSQQTGLDPRLIIAQAAHESGWGQSAPGNNFFGIKGQGTGPLSTMESVNGQMVPTKASFAAYDNADASVDGYGKLMMHDRYAPVRNAQGLDAQIDALGKSGYATDPNYASRIRNIASGLDLSNMPNAPAQPGAQPPITVNPNPAPATGAMAADTPAPMSMPSPTPDPAPSGLASFLNPGSPSGKPSLSSGLQMMAGAAGGSSKSSAPPLPQVPVADAHTSDLSLASLLARKKMAYGIGVDPSLQSPLTMGALG